MEMYITKYALSTGIELMVGKPYSDGKYFSVAKPGFYCHSLFSIDKDAFSSLDDAILAANKMREKKIASMEKKINKLKN